MTFKVGDKIKAKRETDYTITTNGWEGIVIKTQGGAPEDDIQVAERKGGEVYSVNSRYFDLVSSKSIQMPKYKTMTIKNGVKKYICSIGNKNRKELKEQRSYLKENEQSLKELLLLKHLTSGDKEHIKIVREVIKSRTEKIKDLNEKLKTLKIKSIVKDFLKLKEHPEIIGIEAERDCLSIYTKPLKARGKHIGHYHITLFYSSPYSPQIRNLYKRRRKEGGEIDHWFIRNATPCFGRWHEGIRKHLGDGNLYLTIDSILRFLQSTYRSNQGFMTFRQFSFKY